MNFYNYDKETKVFLSTGNLAIDSKKTVALGRTVLIGSIPDNATILTPSNKVGKCWFMKGKWTDVNPHKKTVPTGKVETAKTESKK